MVVLHHSKRAIRLIANSEWNAHTAPLFRDLNILTTHQLNLLHVALFMYEVNISLIFLYLNALSTVTIQDNVMIFTCLIIGLSRSLIAYVSM